MRLLGAVDSSAGLTARLPARPLVVAILLRLWPLEQHRVGGAVVGYRPMLHSSRDHEQVARIQLDLVGVIELDAECSAPAQEHLVLIVVVPRELPVESGKANDGVV